MPRTKPQPMHHDDDADESSIQRVISARGARAPATNAPNSVFGLGRQAQAASRIPPLEAHQITIRKGVPQPPASRGKRGSYIAVIAQMAPTDSVELPIKQARGFYAACKEYCKTTAPPQSYSFRKLTDEIGAIWRDA